MRRVRLSLCCAPAFLMLITIGSAAAAGGSAQAADERTTACQGPKPPLGFAPRAPAPGQLAAEAHAIAVPTPENARKLLRTLTAEPHVAGTPADYKTAVFVRDKLREWGWKAEIAEMEVLLNYPASLAGRSRSIGPMSR